MESVIKLPVKAGSSKSFDVKGYGFAVNRPYVSNNKKEVGIEVELEGRNWPRDTPKGWTVHNEGSLRGGVEYVLNKPVKRENVEESLDALYGSFISAGTTLSCSIRTSVHIHLNTTGMSINQIASFVSLWFIFEETLINWCDPSRVGNLFCLRAVDDPNSIDQWVSALRSGLMHHLYGEEQRYYALNPASLRKFGSFEIRALEGCDKPERILIWTEALLRIKDLACGKYSNPMLIPSNFSGKGGEQFFLESFEGCKIIDDYPDKTNVDRECWEGLRRVQPLFFCVDWYGLVEESNKPYVPNPFEQEELRPRGRAIRAEIVQNGMNAVDFEAELMRLPPLRAPNVDQQDEEIRLREGFAQARAQFLRVEPPAEWEDPRREPDDNF